MDIFFDDDYFQINPRPICDEMIFLLANVFHGRILLVIIVSSLKMSKQNIFF